MKKLLFVLLFTGCAKKQQLTAPPPPLRPDPEPVVKVETQSQKDCDPVEASPS